MRHPRTATYLASLLIFSGLVVTLQNYRILHGVTQHWPALLLVLGIGFILLFYQRRSGDVVLLWLGTFISGLGIFFYVLNFTRWSVLSHWWPIFLGLVGVSFLAMAIQMRKALYAYFAAIFIAFFVILTLVFTVSIRLWPMSFVVFGLSLMVLEALQNKNDTKEIS